MGNENQLIMTAFTNTRKGSIVDAPLEKKYICSLQVMKNKVMGDYLPIIPANSRVANKKVLFHLELEATLIDKLTGRPVPNKNLQFKSTLGNTKKIAAAKPTDSDGKTIVILETREQGDLKLGVKNPDVKMDEFPINIKEAWYEATFILTNYVIFKESSHRFKGEMVDEYDGIKVDGGNKHKKDFLKQVKMQGSGRTARLVNPILKYDTYNRIFIYKDKVIGCKSTELRSNYSIAVDPKVLPFFHKVIVYFNSKKEIGLRYAEDRGSRVKDHHFDLFMASEEERDIWVDAHGDKIFGAYVKYIGKD